MPTLRPKALCNQAGSCCKDGAVQSRPHGMGQQEGSDCAAPLPGSASQPIHCVHPHRLVKKLRKSLDKGSPKRQHQQCKSEQNPILFLNILIKTESVQVLLREMLADLWHQQWYLSLEWPGGCRVDKLCCTRADPVLWQTLRAVGQETVYISLSRGPPCSTDRRGHFPSAACQQQALCVCVQHLLSCCLLLGQVTFSTDAGWDQSAPGHVCGNGATIIQFVWTTVVSALSSFPSPPFLPPHICTASVSSSLMPCMY